MPGARINYSIAVNAIGSGTATNAVFTDNIPANTTYVPGTLRLNSAAALGCASMPTPAITRRRRPRTCACALGSLTTASGPQTITFAVTIN